MNHTQNARYHIPARDLNQFDIDAIGGRNNDLPKFKDHKAVLALCRHYIGVYRKRVSSTSLEVCRDENGEEIWIVGELGEMPRSEMLDLAKEYDRIPGRFSR